MKKLLLLSILISISTIRVAYCASNSITYSGSPFTYTTGVTITTLTPTITNSGNLIAVNPVTISPSLPAGLSINSSNGVISGTPTAASASTPYTITAHYNSGNVTTTITITVNTNSISYSGSPYTYTQGVAITSLTPTKTGGTVSTYTVNPSLPSGLTIAPLTGVISGTPSAITPATNYTITANFSTGTPSTATATINITVNLGKPIISYTSPQSYTQNVAITSLSPTNTGGVATSYSATLPAGLSIDPVTGIISGTPTTISSATAYTITATNAAGSGTFSLTITVNPVAPSISYSPASYTFSKNTYSTTATPTNTGGAVTTWSSSPALPAGLSFSTDTSGTIIGTPTATSASTNYTITATNGGGSSSFVINITVNAISVFDWTGNGSDQNWTTLGNWNYNGVAATAATGYPGQFATSGSNTNIVRFGVTNGAVTNSFTKSPTISSTLPNSIASMEFGANAPSSFNMTINTGVTVSMTGNFTIDGGGSVKAKVTGSSTSLLSIGGDYYAGSGSTFTNIDCPMTISGNFTNYSNNSSFGTALLTFNSGDGSNGSYKLKSLKSTTFNNVLFTGSGGVALIQKLTGGAGIFYISSTGTLSFSGNTKLNVTSGKLTLLSDASGSATITAIPSTCQINGTVNVQRYISGTRGWRLLSSPVYASTDSYGNPICSINYLKNSIYISGPSGTAGGFDLAGNFSIALYREDVVPDYTTFSFTNYRGLNNILTDPTYSVFPESGTYHIPVANGYQTFIRGDRATGTLAAETTNSATYSFTSVILTASGTINQGTITFKNWYTLSSNSSYLSYANPDPTILGYNLVGNPYPSSIDWDWFSNTDNTQPIYGNNVSTTIYSYNFTNKQYAVYQTGTTGGKGTNGGSHIIGSGQGFLAVATGSGATLTFNESAKTSSAYTGVTTLMSRQPITASVIPMMRLRIALDTINTDETIILLDNNAKSTFDQKEDAPYKAGSGKLSLNSLSQDSVALAINHLPLKSGQTVRLNIGASSNGTFAISLQDLIGLPKMYDIWLKDSFAGDSVNLRTTNTYSFTIDKSNTATFGKSRFSVIVKQDPAYAYKLLSFAATRIGNSSHVQTQWNTVNEENYTNFTVERSTDGGVTFQVLGGMWGSGAGNYSLMDKDAVTGTNLYRLKSEDINNVVTYSNIATVVINDKGNSDKISVYPNPATSVVKLDVLDKTNGNISYNIIVSNSTGFIVKQATSPQPNWQTDVSDLMPGTYLVRVTNGKTQSLVGERKFIKL